MILSKRKHAFISGLSLIAMALTAGYAYGYVYSTLVIPGIEQETFKNIETSLNVFIGGIVGWSVILALDILVSFTLHGLLKEIHPIISKITAALRIVYSIFLGLAIAKLLSIVPMMQDVANAQLIAAQLAAFESIWSNGLIVFGMHLFGLGILTLRAHHISKVFPYLLLFAGICYSGIHVAKQVMPAFIDQIAVVEMTLSLPMALAEIGFAFWLVIKGGKAELRTQKHNS